MEVVVYITYMNAWHVYGKLVGFKYTSPQILMGMIP